MKSLSGPSASDTAPSEKPYPRVVLCALNSSYSHTNPAVRQLCCALREAGYSASFCEGTVNEHKGVFSMVERLFEMRADLYGFSVYIWNAREQFLCAACLKQLLPSASMVFGGPEVSFEGDDFFKEHPYADYLIRGEGEEALLGLVRRAERGERPGSRIIDGGLFRDFSKTPEPYLSHPFSLETEADLSGRLVYYESARGCPFSCTYCLAPASSGHGAQPRVRAKQTDLVLAELSRLQSSRVRTIKLLDRTFNFDARRTFDIFAGLIDRAKDRMDNGRYCGAPYHFEICASLLDEAQLDLLEHAPEGLFRFEIGIQSTNPEVLRAIGRRDDVEKSLDNIRQLRDAGRVRLHLDLIAGLPCEDWESFRRSFDTVFPLADELQLGFLKLIKGTELRGYAWRNGLLFSPEPPYQVLATPTLSFLELRRLAQLEEGLSLYSPHKGGFEHSIGYLSKRCASMFDFFLGLADHLKAVHGQNAASSKQLYGALAQYVRERNLLPSLEVDVFCDYVRLDFLTHQPGGLPVELKGGRRLVFSAPALAASVRTGAISDLTLPQDWFWPAVEAWSFLFDPDCHYLIDRKSRHVVRLPANAESSRLFLARRERSCRPERKDAGELNEDCL